MQQTYTAVIKQDGDWWIGWVEEVPGANAQESTREALLKSLREVLAEALSMTGTRHGRQRGVATRSWH